MSRVQLLIQPQILYIHTYIKYICIYICRYISSEADLANSSGSVPDKIVPISVVTLALVHYLSDQIVHCHGKHWQRP